MSPRARNRARPVRRARPAAPPVGSTAATPASDPPATAAPSAALTLAEVQRRVDAWIGQFEAGYWPPLSMLARLTEEVGELARELNHRYGHKPKKKGEPDGDVGLEVADILFVLACLCNALHIDMSADFERVLDKYTRRDATRWTPRR
jgi:NTP pyrophosphatase (non-canonical NTP hydrolase)